MKMFREKHKIEQKIEEKAKIDEILASLLIELKDISNWRPYCDDEIKHKKYPIVLDKKYLFEPTRLTIPRKWRKEIKKRIDQVHHKHDMDNLQFAHNVIKKVYPLCVSGSKLNEESKTWLEENANEDQYFYKHIRTTQRLFIKDDDIAVAFKLRFE